MEHRIVIEILIKTDKKEEEVSKVNSLKINPEMINQFAQLLKGFTKEEPKKKEVKK